MGKKFGTSWCIKMGQAQNITPILVNQSPANIILTQIPKVPEPWYYIIVRLSGIESVDPPDPLIRNSQNK